jgi:hypothetical protein
MVVQRLVVLVEVSNTRHCGEAPRSRTRQHRYHKTGNQFAIWGILKFCGHGAGLRQHRYCKAGNLFPSWGILKFCGHGAGLSFDEDRKSVVDIAFANVLHLARHATISNAAMYQRDAATQLAFLKRDNFLTVHSISTWESIHIEDRTTIRGICGPSEYYQKDLSELSVHYADNILKIKINGTVTVRKSLEAARKYKRQNARVLLLLKRYSRKNYQETT